MAGRLKEADAFQRLVCGRLAIWERIGFAGLKEADAFQRLVCEFRRQERADWLLASKKQTPFSVWYIPAPPRSDSSKSRLKEADAFQRLVFVRAAYGYIRRYVRASKKQTPFSVWYSRCKE